MSASERLRKLDQYAWPAPWDRTVTGDPEDVAVANILRNALPEIVAVVEGAESLPEFFQTPDGRTHSFVPLLDALEEKLTSPTQNISDELGGL